AALSAHVTGPRYRVTSRERPGADQPRRPAPRSAGVGQDARSARPVEQFLDQRGGLRREPEPHQGQGGPLVEGLDLPRTEEGHHWLPFLSVVSAQQGAAGRQIPVRFAAGGIHPPVAAKRIGAIMFFKGSRYAAVGDLMLKGPDGREIKYKKTRFIPPAVAQAGHLVPQREALGHIAPNY